MPPLTKIIFGLQNVLNMMQVPVPQILAPPRTELGKASLIHTTQSDTTWLCTGEKYAIEHVIIATTTFKKQIKGDQEIVAK